MKEAAARIKINRLLEEAGWRFFDDDNGRANICLEAHAPIKHADLDALGDDFERPERGFVDFLLLDDRGFPLIVLEAKSESKEPLSAKEQARRYARSLNCRFVILSNGNLHYFWDLERGNPHPVTAFPTPQSAAGVIRVTPDPQSLADEPVGDDYIVLSQRPNYAADAAWRNDAERAAYVDVHHLSFLRNYQLAAVHALQRAVKGGADRFLFEMATGTGKTLTAAAVVKLFLRTGNARRVLFLVDRLELEDQAHKVFTRLLSTDYTTVIYKERRDDWCRAEIVVTTVQSLLFNNKYRSLFSPTDFDLVISDEAHRSIGGNARAVFDFFTGYKLGLTATPKDYLRGADHKPNDPRSLERRILLDTYRTFGCESGEPTFRYSLLEGARDGVLVNPLVVDARTDVTTQLLSEEGFVVSYIDEETGEESEQAFGLREYEKRFFSEATDRVLCETFLANALRDPLSGEVGKSIVFTVSQSHAARVTQALNEIADAMFPGRYRSDFAVQVTSQVRDAQEFTRRFTNNNLMGSANFIAAYKTGKARVCVTVGMMTTGYDCPDILNLALFRPVFSPSEFVQIKGRGTRPHDFAREFIGGLLAGGVPATEKTTFKLFDFFAVCEYFETEFNYDERLELPAPRPAEEAAVEPLEGAGASGHTTYVHPGSDRIREVAETSIGLQGMKIDRMLFDRFAGAVRADETVAAAVEAGQWDRVIDYVNREVFDKPEEYYTLDKLRAAVDVDRRLTLREILEKVFDLIPRFKSKDELLEEEFNQFVAQHEPQDPEAVPAIKRFFKAYVTNDVVRGFIESGDFTQLAANPVFSLDDLRAVPIDFRKRIPDYVKDYVPLNRFAA